MNENVLKCLTMLKKVERKILDRLEKTNTETALFVFSHTESVLHIWNDLKEAHFDVLAMAT